MSNFQHPGETGTVSIVSFDKGKPRVTAQYNPKELQVDKPVAWQKNPQANKSPEKGIQLEFTGAEGRSMTLELLFDGFEKKTSIADKVRDLNTLASPLKAGSTNENERRPHMCVVTWGETIPSFRCVIESLSVKYTMFSEDGVPLRATCTVKLKEADVVQMAKADGGR
jgi:Contractile injection system tube protein